jgi:pimeloyl-ACP methyl ester carboxylesterase
VPTVARALLALGACLLAASGAAGCTSSRGGRSTTTTTLANGVTTTSIVPVTVAGTTDSGAAASLGSVMRLPVMPVPAGRLSTDVPAPSSRAYGQVVPVAYRQLGSGPALILVPSQAASMNWWSPALLQQLARHYRVTVFDLPGTGYSGSVPRPLGVQWLADVTAGLSGELGLQSPTVVGWGLGGQVALALGERHRGLASDLVIVDSGLPLHGAQPMSGRAEHRFGSGIVTPSLLATYLFPAGSTTSGPARRAWLTALLQQVPDTVTPAQRGAEAALEHEVWHTGPDSHIGQSLRSLHTPVLVVAGALDTVFPPVDGQVLAHAIPGAQLYRWNGQGYGGLVADPQQFATVLEQFTG